MLLRRTPPAGGQAVRKLPFAVLLLAPSLAFAAGYSLPNTNPRDLALSASAVAAQNDSGAAFALPAALSKLDGFSVHLSAGGITVFNTWTDPTGASPATDMKKKLTPFPNINVAWGGRLADMGVGAGIGFQPFGGAIVEWPQDWAGRYRIVKVTRRVYSGVATVGVEVLPMLRLGGGFVYYYTTQELSQKSYMAPFAPGSNPNNPATWNPSQPDATATVNTNGGAVSYDLSAEFGPLPEIPLTIAVDYKHKATQNTDGDVKWDGLTPTAQALGASGAVPIFVNQKASERLIVPNTLNVGAAYRVIPPLQLTFTWTLDRWIVYNEDNFVGANGAALAVPRQYRNGYTLRGGAEYDVSKELQLRIGLQRDVSGVRPEFYSPTLPDQSSWAGSIGAGYNFGGGFSVDAAVFYANMDSITATNTGLEPQATPPSTFVVRPTGTFRGSYDISALVWGVSFGWTQAAKR